MRPPEKQFLISFGCCCRAGVLLAGLLGSEVWAVDSMDDLTGPWKLFVDDFPVAAKSNVVRTYHAFQKHAGNPIVVVDRPWEGLVYLYGTVLHDESGTGYRMWYHTLRTNSACSDGSLELYATSTNGINWVKPVLNLRTACGATTNNMFLTRADAGGITSVMHTPWDPDPNKHYKFMNYGSGGYYGAWSSNGIHVVDAPGNPVFTGGSDVGQFCWDPHTQRYLGYVKNAWYDWNGLKRRAVALTTTTNITTWPRESLILWPDAFDDRWAIPGSVQRTHFYGLSAFPYESMYIGFLWIFRATELDGEMPGYLIGPCFVELVSSQDSVHWNRQGGDRPPVLPLGAAGTWDDGMVFTARAPVRDGDTLKLWYGGFDQVHGTALSKTKGAIGLATLRKDGFASLDAGATTGIILTWNLVGANGPLRVNYQAVGGSVKVEVLDANNNVLPGYAQADCVALTGDNVNQAVTWTTRTELPASPAFIRLRFILQNASIYSFMAGESAVLGVPPVITQQPPDQAIPLGGTASFIIAANGNSPLSYRWQKNQVSHSDGGHYSGCMTATLIITGADTNDVASYRCVVTNVYGSAHSDPALLTLAATCPSVNLANGNFEGGDTGGLANGWTAYQRAPYPTTTTWTIQTASPPTGGGLHYQQIANSSSSGGGGVRQDVTGCIIGATYRVSGWMRGNSMANSTCTVKVSPTVSTNWATAIDLTPPQSYTGNTWVPFSGTVKATGTSMTLWLDGRTGGTGQFKAECFDSVTVTCESVPKPLGFASVALLPEQEMQLILSGPAGSNVMILRASNLVDWQPWLTLSNVSGALRFTDTTASNAPQRFYRATMP